ncbi:MAG TPA: YciI family protein [Deltaproteobacteria bacterium]|nr:YciI family protein [Deltaproteobacteria bacterium]HQI81596.1 YciI family protein [Deltaproteobacteria bacterium]
MHFLLIARDGTDEKALERRLASRERHLASITRLKAEGKALYGAALIDEDGTMRGSVLIMSFGSREEFDQYLADEPYMCGKVWQEIEVKQCRVPELFLPTGSTCD